MYPPSPPSWLSPSCGRQRGGGILPTGSPLPPLLQRIIISICNKQKILKHLLQTLNWAVLVCLLQAAGPSTAQNNLNFCTMFETIVTCDDTMLDKRVTCRQHFQTREAQHA